MGVNSKKILVGLIYRHPGTSVTEFTKQFSDFLSNITLQIKIFAYSGILTLIYLKKIRNNQLKTITMKFVALILLM